MISETNQKTLEEIYLKIPENKRSLFDELIKEILNNAENDKNYVDFFSPIKGVENLLSERLKHFYPVDDLTLRRAVVAKLALKLPTTISHLHLPGDILSLYPQSIDKLLEYLLNKEIVPYNSDNDPFCKDIRFVLGKSVPCGLMVVDVLSRISVRSILKSALFTFDFRKLFFYLSGKGNGFWYRGHIDTRYLEDFNEAGYDASCLRIAHLLKHNKHMRGLVGTSWIHDPQILTISPHLAYWQLRPVERGGFLVRNGPGPNHTERAIATSKTRRRLYEEGKYVPICHSFLYPRDSMLLWAESSGLQ